MRTIPLLAAISMMAALVGCGAAARPPSEPSDQEASPAEPTPTPAAEPAAAEPHDAPPSAEAGGAQADTGSKAPEEESPGDDYHVLLRGDCDQLGKQLAALTRADQVAALNPKLTAQQRAQAEKNIETVAGKLGEQYTQSCEKNLGKAIPTASMKCAFDARSVKDFDVCLNGPSAESPKKKK